jgi:hypothetical protein
MRVNACMLFFRLSMVHQVTLSYNYRKASLKYQTPTSSPPRLEFMNAFCITLLIAPIIESETLRYAVLMVIMERHI